MIAGLNRAYKVKENRRLWRILIIAFGLTISLEVMGLIALGAMLYTSLGATTMGEHLGVHAHSPLLWRMIQWPLIVILLLFSFASLYRFGPNLKDRRWQWSVPGAVVATTLWVSSTLLLRVYDEQFSSHHRIYGPLKPAAVLLLWLYFTGRLSAYSCRVTRSRCTRFGPLIWGPKHDRVQARRTYVSIVRYGRFYYTGASGLAHAVVACFFLRFSMSLLPCRQGTGNPSL
jgi:uncharacterized BrkB/YihY/UPF0761 family membrane protein